jgi:death-on-curing protein
VQRSEPVWIEKKVALAIQDRQLAEHGGPAGLRDEPMLEFALARPMNRWAYGEDDSAMLAAAYAFGLARNHPFADGNKRTAWVLARLFLELNGHDLVFKPSDAIAAVLRLAASDLSEDEMADWFRQRLARLP